MIGCWVGGLYLNFHESSIFIDWVLGGGSIRFNATLVLDYVRLFFLGIVICISTNVIWYSKGYIHSDPNASRFVLLVLGFVISMILLILSPNILRILLGWDGLGLISYCLVIYYPSKKSNRAGILTVLSNRVGDACVLLSIAWFRILGDFNLLGWRLSKDTLDTVWLPMLVLIAAITKRAQIPFSAWLPAAIAAPTPVSALVHSSTLVTAGVYLLIRFSFLLDPYWSTILIVVSIATMLISGIVAIFEYDLKKVIALSTLRQLGIIIFAISIGLYNIAFFHILAHALFKALLFLCAGALIHGGGGSQDIRHFGAIVNSNPITSTCLNLANFSLCGIPFLAGFYSKDIIVELMCQRVWGLFMVVMTFICLGLTVLYTVRLTFFRIINFKSGTPTQSLTETDHTLVGPIMILTATSLISGPSMAWILFSSPSLIILPSFIKLCAIIFVTLSFLVATAFLTPRTIGKSVQRLGYYAVGHILFIPRLRGRILTETIVSKSDFIMKNLDQGWLEHYTYFFTYESPYLINTAILKTQQNRLKKHFTVFIIWAFLGFVYLICFYSLSLKHSTEDARIIRRFKNKLLESNSSLQWKCNVIGYTIIAKVQTELNRLESELAAPLLLSPP